MRALVAGAGGPARAAPSWRAWAPRARLVGRPRRARRARRARPSARASHAVAARRRLQRVRLQQGRRRGDGAGEALRGERGRPVLTSPAPRSAAGALLVHVSTDYVFDGAASPALSRGGPARVRSAPTAVASCAGEMLVRGVGAAAPGRAHQRRVRHRREPGQGRLVRRAHPRARAHGRRAPARRRRPGASRPPTRPTWPPPSSRSLDAGARGLVHVTNEGDCTWHELAQAALELAGCARRVDPSRPRSWRARARPAYSVLSNARFASGRARPSALARGPRGDARPEVKRPGVAAAPPPRVRSGRERYRRSNAWLITKSAMRRPWRMPSVLSNSQWMPR